MPYAEIPTRLKSAPFSVRILAAALPGKPWWLMRLAFMARFGRADRDIGSGVYIEEWDLPEGMLRLSEGRGPLFFEKGSGQLMPLLRTVNPLEACLLNTSCDVRLGRGYYAGNLKLRPDSTYSRDGQFVAPASVATPRSFLLEHSVGRVEIHYAAGITPGSLLEEIPDGTTVAVMEFLPEDGRAGISVQVISDLREGGLRLIESKDDTGETATFTTSVGRKDTGMRSGR